MRAGEVEDQSAFLAAFDEPEVLETCPECDYFPTKPGQEPLHLAAALVFATTHAQRVTAGLRLTSVDQLTPHQWAAVTGMQRGQDRFKEWSDLRTREQREEEARRAAANRK